MQPKQIPGQSLGYTNRYKPSRELMQITKRKMDESDELIRRLEKRIEQSGSSAEKQALMEKLNQLKA